MFSTKFPLIAVCALTLIINTVGCRKPNAEISRPERIQSLRTVGYGRETYAELAKRWKEYYDVFPSEDAYGNWMYAARYAKDPDYKKLLKKGLSKYPANPLLLYLSGIKRLGALDDTEGLQHLERAVAMDPTFLDPWYSLVIQYMGRDEMEQMDVALRRLLEGNAISESVMDYSYNMLAGLQDNAILITNGDNDTYPGWILTRLLDYRKDVDIVNRSLLNSEWYPLHIIGKGVPTFITSDELEELRSASKPPFSDTLIVRLIKAAEREKRPVYFAASLAPSGTLDPYKEAGVTLGLATLVTRPSIPYPDEIEKMAETWINEYRTVGLDGWRIHNIPDHYFDRSLVINYAASLYQMLEPIEAHAPQYRLALFNWYRNHCTDLIPQKYSDKMNRMWCRFSDIPDIGSWCREKGYLE